MAGLAPVAVGLAALRSGSKGWFQVMYGLTLFTLATATLLARFRTGRVGAFWSGFALFGWVYLLLVVSNLVGFATHIDNFYNGPLQMPADLFPTVGWLNALISRLEAAGWLPQGKPQGFGSAIVQAQEPIHRAWVAQFLAVLLVGVLGGLWGRWLAGGTAPPLVRGSDSADHG